ncbi:MAG: RsmE family RNA methyltransferase [Candidatus Dependentiae bacterium]|nr:RsmE family RNA methyltransferase [Candidatus Dependentiae bacterium]
MLNKDHGQKHIFSFFCPSIIQSSWSSGSIIWLQDEDLVHRLIKVVKVEKDDEFVLFDKERNVFIKVLSVLKKEIQAQVLSLQDNVLLQPKITFLLPLLKKEALEQAVYSLTEIGVSEIRLVVTAKSRQSLMSPKEYQRLCGIVVAAAEQSKNYNFSELFEPETLSNTVIDKLLPSCKIVFDAAGESFFEIKKDITRNQSVTLFVGPEGGLLEKELSFLSSEKFQKCALTQTTLRAVQAVAVSAALFRLS